MEEATEEEEVKEDLAITKMATNQTDNKQITNNTTITGTTIRTGTTMETMVNPTKTTTETIIREEITTSTEEEATGATKGEDPKAAITEVGTNPITEETTKTTHQGNLSHQNK